MSNLIFIKARSTQEALELLTEKGPAAMLVAGGTDVMVARRQGQLKQTTHLIDISGIDALKTIDRAGDRIRLGGGATHHQCELSPLLRDSAPILSEACSWIGSPQIRNRATIGGNIITAASCADTPPALAALAAVCELESLTGTRQVPLMDLCQNTGQTVRRFDELLTGIYFNVPPAGTRQTFIKLIRRKAVAKSRLTVAVIGRQRKDKTIAHLRIVIGSATPGPLICRDAAAVLKDRIPEPELMVKASKAVSQEMIFVSGRRWSTEYKQPAVEALTLRALKRVLED